MKKTITMVLIALHFAKMSVEKLIPFAGGIKTNAGSDKQIKIDPGVIATLDGQITDLSATVELRLTNKSKSLTTLEGSQATAVIITLTDIANEVEKQANAIAAGDIAAATTIIQRIGYVIKKVAEKASRTFEVFKTLVATVYIRVKADKKVNIYHWRWSADKINWVRLPDTTVASIIITDLPEKATAYFESATTLKVKGAPTISAIPAEPEWGDTISKLIP